MLQGQGGLKSRPMQMPVELGGDLDNTQLLCLGHAEASEREALFVGIQ